MFVGCTSLKDASLEGIDTSKSQDFRETFKGCQSLERIDLSMLDFSAATDLSYMFQMCRSLKSIDLSPVDMSHVTDMSGMFAGCRSLTSLDLSGHTWSSSGANMAQIISTCPNLTEIVTDANVTLSSSTYAIGGEEGYVKTRIVGEASDSFNEYFIGKLQGAQRYLAVINIRAGINLVGDESYDSWHYGVMISNNKRVKIKENQGADSIYFDGVENRLYLYAEGLHTITLTQGDTAFDLYTGYDKVGAVTETEDGFRCGNNPLTKTINVIRHNDGSIDIEEV